jgi:hypothetical protein
MRKDVEIVAGALAEAHAGWSAISEPGRPTWEAVAKELLDKGIVQCMMPLKHVLTFDPPQPIDELLKIVHDFGRREVVVQAFNQKLQQIHGWALVEFTPDYVVMPKTSGIKVSKVVILG